MCNGEFLQFGSQIKQYNYNNYVCINIHNSHCAPIIGTVVGIAISREV